ncbi:thiol reductant ABC exporter subunit CydD [Sphingomonas sp. CL5.1]|uniref:thiol reductant ABC exporter subunit CydD n=1 Tax=Sphingomonas sp. CL5.1 TaxID=2653203 RepID=UPI001581B340|nr:thiol reductant ABC exporter subunit CydD [Sphingomonas sp. CL5.1]QKR99851.1 thiol reductant ABC exporter subunit CydD [Sphingomonas sp. CL5.1]
MSNRFDKHGASFFWVADSGAAIVAAAALAGAVASAGRGDRHDLMLAIGGLAAAAVLRALMQIGATNAGEVAAVRAKTSWRQRVFPRVLVAAPGERRMLGEAVADAVDRIEDLGGFHARFLPLRRAAILSPLLIAIAAGFGSWIAGGIMLATLVPFALGMALAGTAAARAAARQLDALSRLSGLFVDRVRALPVIVGFGAQERIGRHLGDATREVAARTIDVLKVAFVSSAIIEFFAALSIALVALYCGFNLLGILPFPVPEKPTLGQALFVLVLAPEFYLPMRRLAAAYHDKQVGEAAVERLEALAPAARPAPKAAIAGPPALRFEGVVIDYGETAIGPFTLDVAAGTSLALRGSTGIGKSSLLHALLGLAPIGAGRILVDGLDAAETALCGHIGWAGQSVAFVPGTLADNIRLARPEADDATIEAAARRAGLGPMIEARRQGLALPLDHRGSGLSGGERRRVGIARVLLKDAPLWLLDEPTADLDARSAADIAGILAAAGKGRTVLMATHSAELAATADREMALA